VLLAIGLTWGDICPATESGNGRQLIARRASEVVSRPPRFAWRWRIVLGVFNLFVGQEGIGKGALISWLMAHWTRGTLEGDLLGTPINVAIVGDEDGFDSVWKPRLYAAGADLERVVSLEPDDGGLLVFTEDREQLERYVEELELTVVYFDSIFDNLGAKVEMNDQKQQRHSMQPLRAIARRLGIATIGTCHPNKRGQSYRELVAGSPALNAISRSSLLLAQDPEDPELRVVLRGKGNLCPNPEPMRFGINESSVELDDRVFSVPLITDPEFCEVDLDDVLRGAKVDRTSETTQAAMSLISSMLPADGEWHPSKPILDRARLERISDAAVYRARIALSVRHRWAQSFPARGTEWRRALPGSKPRVQTSRVKDEKPGGAERAGGTGKQERNRESPVKPTVNPDPSGFSSSPRGKWTQGSDRPAGSDPPAAAETVALDVETTGLDPRSDRLVLVGFAADDQAPVVLEHPADRELIQRWLELGAQYVGHHLGFDLHFLEAAGYAIPSEELWQDTMILAHLAGQSLQGQTKLDRLQHQLIDAGELEQEIIEPEHRLKRWLTQARKEAKKVGGRPRPQKGDAPRSLLDPYLVADVRSTRAAAGYYGGRLNGQAKTLELERAVLPAIFAAERRGVPLDLESVSQLRVRSAERVAQLRQELFEIAGRAFNPAAVRQVEQALIDLGADLVEVPRTPRANLPMFTSDTLPAIGHPLADTLHSYREEKKLRDYIEGLWTFSRGSRLYGSFRQVGTSTGRMSSGSPNLQNIPRSDLRVRYAIAAGEGRMLVGADLDSVELRVLASYAPGGELERSFAEDRDLHQQSADWCGLTRDQGKVLNYCSLYGGGAAMVAKVIGGSIEEGREVLERWYQLYPEVDWLKARLAHQVRAKGYLQTAYGRQHHFDEPNHMLINRLISGTCADLFKVSIVELHRAGAAAVLYVHDEIVCEAQEDRAEETGELLERVLTRGTRRITNLQASSAAHGRWSQFKDPE
jgi:DNA polymerase-1